MEQEVRNELETIKGMVLRWKESHLEWASSDGGDEFLVEELAQEIETHVYPYIKRLFECKYLSAAEAKEFLDSCYVQVEELRDAVGQAGVTRVRQKGG